MRLIIYIPGVRYLQLITLERYWSIIKVLLKVYLPPSQKKRIILSWIPWRRTRGMSVSEVYNAVVVRGGGYWSEQNLEPLVHSVLTRGAVLPFSLIIRAAFLFTLYQRSNFSTHSRVLSSSVYSRLPSIRAQCTPCLCPPTLNARIPTSGELFYQNEV